MPVIEPAVLLESFIAGLLTPLTAACVIPLYPAYLSYLTEQETARSTLQLGMAVAGGVLSFMLVLGLLFSTVLQQSLTGVVRTVSPIAFTGLLAASIVLLLDLDLGSRFRHIKTPSLGRPLVDAFSFGFFFGAIVLPCNPGFIAYFLSRQLLIAAPATALGNFFAFGLGMAVPLLGFSAASDRWSEQVIGRLTAHKTVINRVAGGIMLVVSLYYLTVVFHVIPV